jgi:hypothetical protein
VSEAGYAAEHRRTVLSGVTELLVHGVGGETPGHTLDEPHPVQVAGDTTAGFHRGPDVEGRHREAYSWGGLTSGTASRALWVLLLPFALANLAGWMHWRRREEPEPSFFRGLVRLFGLSLTLLGVLYVCSIAFDLIAFQCGGDEACVGADRPSRPWWSPVRWVALLEVRWLADHAARQLAAAAVVPLAVVGLLGYLARSTRDRHERAKPAAVDRQERRGEDPFELPMEAARSEGLQAERFWYGEPLARALGRAHLAAAIAATAWALAAAAQRLGGRGWGIGAGQVLAWVVLAVAVLAVCVPDPLRVRRLRWDLRGLPSLGLVALALTAYGAWVQVPYRGSRVEQLPELGGVARLVYTVHLALVLVLAVDAVRVYLRQRPGEPGTLRCGPLAAVVLASVILNAVLAGLSVRIADMLGWAAPAGGSVTARGQEAVIRYPQVYDLFAVGFVAGLLVVAVVVVLAWLGTGRSVPLNKIRDDYRDEDPGVGQDDRRHRRPPPEDATGWALPPADDRPDERTELHNMQRRWVKSIRRRRRLVELVRRLDRVLVAIVVVTLALALAGFVGDALGRPLQAPQGTWWGRLSAGCSWVVALVPAAAVGVILSGYRDRGRRRQLGVLWDVCMFWPRAFHPLAPPSYGERAVPDLQRRIDRLVRNRQGRQGRVLLMAHSQGAVLAAAALLQLRTLNPDYPCRVGLVTYGAPLVSLYRRAFPAYVGGGTFAELRDALGPPPAGTPARWRNFYRETDPIGGGVFPEDRPLGGGVDQCLRDPDTSRYVPDEPLPPLRGHSGYMHDPEMRGHVTALARRLRVEAEPRPD